MERFNSIDKIRNKLLSEILRYVNFLSVPKHKENWIN